VQSGEGSKELDIVSLIAIGITAAATVAIAILAIPTIKAYRKQVQIGQDQVKVSQEQLFNQFRPVLYPVGDLEKIIDRSAGKHHIKWEYQNQEIDGLRNIGVGPAFNIYGILFGPPVNSQPPRMRYVVWNYPPLTPGVSGDTIALLPGSNISSDTTIKGYTLYVPDDEDHVGVIARFTFTYHDVFGRKHASIYDYHSQIGWMSRGHFSDIEKGIYELDRETPGTKQSNQLFYRAGKNSATMKLLPLEVLRKFYGLP
jgi:hypothetical protein